MKKCFISIITIISVIFTLFSYAFAAEYTIKVIDNHDGDTLTVELNGKKEKVRLVGVDTAEIAQGYWGEEARKYVENLTKGKTLKLETDIQERDMYGRILGYVFIDDKFLNLMLLEDGYAMLLTYPPNVKYVYKFTEAQKKAREAGKGIWNPKKGLTQSPYDFRHNKDNTIKKPEQTNTASPSSTISKAKVHVNIKSMVYHLPGCKNYNCKNCTLELTENEAIKKGYTKCKQEKIR